MTMESPDFTGKPVDQIRTALRYPPAYLQLVYSLLPGCITHPEIRTGLEETGRWIESASEDDLRKRASALWQQYERLLEEAIEKLPPLKPWTSIAEDYWRLCRDKAFTWSTGLPCGWVAERFDAQRLGIWHDLPLHGAIGIGHHAGTAAVEEEFLLRDAFLLLVRSRRDFRRLTTLAVEAKALPDPAGALRQLNALTQSVCTDCRLAVFSFYAFVECFVNSVGSDFSARNATLPNEAKELLQGTKKGHHLSTEKKIEKFAEIIRGDGTRPIVLTDPKQLQHPFDSFVTNVKQLRDSTAHFSKRKEPIWLPPERWREFADDACDTCMEVARRFWDGCYPGRGMPDYLGWLESERHIQIAGDQLDAAEDETWRGQVPDDSGSSQCD